MQTLAAGDGRASVPSPVPFFYPWHTARPAPQRSQSRACVAWRPLCHGIRERGHRLPWPAAARRPPGVVIWTPRPFCYIYWYTYGSHETDTKSMGQQPPRDIAGSNNPWCFYCTAAAAVKLHNIYHIQIVPRKLFERQAADRRRFPTRQQHARGPFVSDRQKMPKNRKHVKIQNAQ